MSLLYVKTYDVIEGDVYTDKPTEGKQFVAFFLECRNDREDSKILLSGSFNAYADDVALNLPDFVVRNDPDGFLSAGTIEPAKRMRLVAIFEATPGWKELELHYMTGILLPTVSLKFKASASEVAAEDYIYTGSPFGEYTLEEDALTPAGTMFSSKNWEIKLLKAKKYDEIGGEKPSAGKIFVMMFFEVKNISSEDNNFSGALFDCFADGCLLPLKLPRFEVEGYKDLSGEVAPDKTLTGYVCLEADKDFSSVEAVYEFSDKTVRFALTADMVE